MNERQNNRFRAIEGLPNKSGLKLYRDEKLEEKREPSVWYVAGVAICLFVGFMVVGGLFTGNEVVAVAAQ